MGYNLAGLLIKKKYNEQEIEILIENKIEFLKVVDFEKATSSSRDENTIDVLQTEAGTLIITELGQAYDLSNSSEDIIQFIISDVSDTYYFEKYLNKTLVRKYITSQGEIAEDTGQGYLSDEDEFVEKIWEYIDVYLQIDFNENMFSIKFKRYKLI